MIESILVLSIFLILNTNAFTAYLAVVFIGLYGIRSKENSVKAMCYLGILSGLDKKIFMGNIQELKTLLSLLFIVNIFIHIVIIERKIKIDLFIKVASLYLSYSIIASLISSKLPLISISKCIYFIVGLISIYLVIKEIKISEWYQWLSDFFKSILLINIPFILYEVSKNSSSFLKSGIYSNSNSLGVVSTISGIFLLFYYFNYYKKNTLIYFILSVVEILLSGSRTSLFTIIIIFSIVMVVVSFKYIKSMNKKYIFVFILTLIMPLLILTAVAIKGEEVNSYVVSKIEKGQGKDILFSRKELIEKCLIDFRSNRITGVGFGVPAQENCNGKRFEIALSKPDERGNIFIGALSETGILGTLLFIFLLITMVINSKKNNDKKLFMRKQILIIGIILLNQGEMQLFSGASVGVIYWNLLAVYMLKG